MTTERNREVRRVFMKLADPVEHSPASQLEINGQHEPEGIHPVATPLLLATSIATQGR